MPILSGTNTFGGNALRLARYGLDDRTTGINAQAVELARQTGVDQAFVAAIRQEFPEQKVIVGGAPVSRQFADEIGAHAYDRDAMHAVDIVALLTGQAG